MKYLIALLLFCAGAQAGMCLKPPVPEDASLVKRDVYMSYTITETGALKNVAVLVSSGNAEFDAYAVECASHWTYRPAVQQGKPVEVPLWMAMMRMQKTDELAAFDKVSSAAWDCLKSAPPTPEDMKTVSGPTVVNVKFVGGKITDAQSVRSSGNASLDERAAQCLRSAAIDSAMGRAIGTTEWKHPTNWAAMQSAK